MTATLQKAIAAARAGDMARAQILAAEFSQANPGDPNGWYLLSQLVESEARRAAYLGKTLELAPDHPRARAEFAALPPALVADLSPAAAPEPLTSDLDTPEPPEPEPVVAEAVVEPVEWQEAPAARPDDTLPTPEEMITDFLGAAPYPAPEPAAETLAEGTPGVPEWLQPLSPEPVAAVAATEPPAAPPAAPNRPAPRPAPARRPNSGNRALSILLGLLAVLTLAVLAFLIYLLLV